MLTRNTEHATRRPLSPRRRALIAIAVSLGGLLLAELIARGLYHPPDLSRVEDLGDHFEPHPYLGVTSEPPVRQYGEGLTRIACLGGSTTREQYTPMLLEALAECGAPEERFAVLDAACPGYTSMESQLALMIYALPKRPNIVVVMHAHNDVQVRLHPGFRPDYTHYRVNPWRRANLHTARRKQLNWWLDRVRLIVVLRETFTGYVSKGRMLENYIVAPQTSAESPRQIFEASSADAYEQHLRNILFACRGSGAEVLLVTQPLSPDFEIAYGSLHGGAPWSGDELVEEISCYVQGQRECNDVVRRLCREHDAALVDWAAEATGPGAGELFSDHVHLTNDGNRRLAKLVAREIVELLKEDRTGGPTLD